MSASSNTKRNLKSTGGEANWVRSSRFFQKLKLLQRTKFILTIYKNHKYSPFHFERKQLYTVAMGGRALSSIYFFTGGRAIFVVKLWIYLKRKRTSTSQSWSISAVLNITFLFWIFFKQLILTTESRSRISPSLSQTRVWNWCRIIVLDFVLSRYKGKYICI